jgi:hypothetical protein
MQVEQNALTLLVPLREGEAANARKTLTQIAKDLGGHPRLRLRDSRRTHFARFVVVDANNSEPRLLFTANYDGGEEAYLEELIATCGRGLDEIFKHCKGYKQGDALHAPRFRVFVGEYSKNPHVFFISLPGLSVQTIQAGSGIRTIVEDVIDDTGPEKFGKLWKLSGTTPRPHVSRRGASRNQPFVDKILAWLVGIRKDGPNPNITLRSPAPVVRLEDTEIHNELTVVAPVKDSMLSRLLLRALLFIGHYSVQGAWGSLSGVTSIHFARWHILDGGRFLMFESNYDGSWDSYIDNFVDVSSGGLDGMWGNCAGYPARGCKDVHSFKAIIRKHQFKAQLFYSAYPDLTVKNIIANQTLSSAVQAFFSTPDIDRVSAGSYEIND